jgi:hypothetical protein
LSFDTNSTCCGVLYEKVYCARGRMENLIKDMKLYTRSDRTFLKIAVRIQELKTRIKMALPSTYPNVQALTALATSIAACGP